MWENNEYRMCFREDSILDFERAMLSSGECSYLLPMMFIYELATLSEMAKTKKLQVFLK